MARPSDKGLITKSKLVGIYNAIRALLGAQTAYNPETAAAALGSITRQSAQTITPSTTAQTITAGKYLAGDQTISPITGTLLHDLDSDFVAGNIKKDVSILGLTGTYEGGATEPYIEEEYNAGGNFVGATLHGYTSVRHYAFYNASRLASVSGMENVTKIGNRAFEGDSALVLSALPSGLVSIGQYAFKDCASLAIAALPPGLTTLAGGAFEGCGSITVSSVPQGVTLIPSYTFNGCSGITHFTFHSGVAAINDRAFASTGLQDYVRFEAANPPTLASSHVFDSTSASLPFVVPYQSSAYLTATNYPSPLSRTYVGFGTFAGGETLPVVQGLNLSLPVDADHFTCAPGSYLFKTDGYDAQDQPVKYVDFINAGTGDTYIETTFNAPVSGTYTIGVLVASMWGQQSEVRPRAYVYENGQQLGAFNCGATNGGSHDAVKSFINPYATVNVTLSAGTHTLRFSGRDTDGFMGNIGGPVTIEFTGNLTPGSPKAWYASLADAVNETNPITQGNGSEVYCRFN